MGDYGARCMFRIKAQNAIKIDCVSAVSDESEWIILPGTSLKVFSTSTTSDGLTVVDLEEVATKRLVG
jgi:hypothetical protein